jgi:hypothetical protein
LTISLVSRESGLVRGDAIELGAHGLAARGLEAPPLVEGRDHARAELRVERVDVEHPLGEERVRASVAGVEARRVRVREGPQERAHAIGVAQSEVGVRAERDHALESAACGATACRRNHLSSTSGSCFQRR